MTNNKSKDAAPVILINTDGPAKNAGAAEKFGVGARNGDQLVAERRTRDVGEYRDRNAK